MSKKQRRAQQQPNPTVDFNQYSKFNRPIEIIPRNLRQEEYAYQLLHGSSSIVFATGPAGTGKTMLAVLAATRALKNGDAARIVITRPAVGVDGEKHGFLPGDLNAKMEPWTRPIFDVLHEHFSPRETRRMLDEAVIEIAPLAFMRGRTFRNAWIIADEMQNSTPSQMKMLLTRLGENSRMIVTGDVRQADRSDAENGLLDFDKLLARSVGSKHINWVKFEAKDIERHPAVIDVLRIYGDE